MLKRLFGRKETPKPKKPHKEVLLEKYKLTEKERGFVIKGYQELKENGKKRVKYSDGYPKFVGENKVEINVVIRQLLFADHNQHQLDKFGHVAVSVSILSAHDCCEECKKYSEVKYELSQVPALPHLECNHDKGCRCTYRVHSFLFE